MLPATPLHAGYTWHLRDGCLPIAPSSEFADALKKVSLDTSHSGHRAGVSGGSAACGLTFQPAWRAALGLSNGPDARQPGSERVDLSLRTVKLVGRAQCRMSLPEFPNELGQRKSPARDRGTETEVIKQTEQRGFKHAEIAIARKMTPHLR